MELEEPKYKSYCQISKKLIIACLTIVTTFIVFHSFENLPTIILFSISIINFRTKKLKLLPTWQQSHWRPFNFEKFKLTEAFYCLLLLFWFCKPLSSLYFVVFSQSWQTKEKTFITKRKKVEIITYKSTNSLTSVLLWKVQSNLSILWTFITFLGFANHSHH